MAGLRPVVVIGGGPGGSVAALCLRRLGRDVVLLEKATHPRYQIGESLLPGTLSILERLGVGERVRAAGFVSKPAATFLWGDDPDPWSFTFDTPKTAPWVFDHAYQVNRAEYDRLLLEVARDRGVDVREGCEVTRVETDGEAEPARVIWKEPAGEGALDADHVVDASGARGLVAQARGLRRWDAYYRNIAVWSYFRGGRPLTGSLAGNTLSVSFRDGWIWIIPLKADVHSIGVVTGSESGGRIRDVGPEAFYDECLDRAPVVRALIEGAARTDPVRVRRDWSYDARTFTPGRVFLCGDAACFVDPLFSQGVHLATYSAMLAAAAIDHLLDVPAAGSAVREWYDRAYERAYQRYHRFVTTFYASNDQSDSWFWSSRRIAGEEDKRFAGVEWFAALARRPHAPGAGPIEELQAGTATLANLWRRSEDAFVGPMDRRELSQRRLRWASELQRDLQGLGYRWQGQEVRLMPSFRVHPTSFRLEHEQRLGDEHGRVLGAFPATEGHRRLFEPLIREAAGFRTLARGLRELGGPGTPLDVILRLIDEGLLVGLDDTGQPARIRTVPRFGGVGADDDMS